MTWSDFYLFCFLVGFSLSVVSFLAGAVHIHLPVKWHLPFHLGHHWGGGHGGVRGAFKGAAEISWFNARSEEHTSELQSRLHLVCRLLLEKKKYTTNRPCTRRSRR